MSTEMTPSTEQKHSAEALALLEKALGNRELLKRAQDVLLYEECELESETALKPTWKCMKEINRTRIREIIATL